MYLGRNNNWEVSQAPFSATVHWGPGKNRDPAQQLNSQQCLLTDKGELVIGQVLCLGACGKSKLSLTFTAHSSPRRSLWLSIVRAWLVHLFTAVTSFQEQSKAQIESCSLDFPLGSTGGRPQWLLVFLYFSSFWEIPQKESEKCITRADPSNHYSFQP